MRESRVKKHTKGRQSEGRGCGRVYEGWCKKKNVLRLAGHVWAWHVSPCEWSGDARHGGTQAARVPCRREGDRDALGQKGDGECG